MEWQTCGVTVWMDSLKCMQFEVESLMLFDHQSLKQTKGQKAGSGSWFDYGPLTFCGFIKRNYNHISDFLSARLKCPWASLSSLRCLCVHPMKTKAGLWAPAKPFYFTLRSGPSTPSMSFFWGDLFFPLTCCQWELKTGLIYRTAECRPHSHWPLEPYFEG